MKRRGFSYSGDSSSSQLSMTSSSMAPPSGGANTAGIGGGGKTSSTKRTFLDLPHRTSSILANDDGQTAKNAKNAKNDVASNDDNDGRGGSDVPPNDPNNPNGPNDPNDHDDRFNYALLLALYTLQGIPMGLSASIPFLIQQKVQLLAQHVGEAASSAVNDVSHHAHHASTSGAHSLADLTKLAYNAQAIFALCSWPFSLKLLWAPIVDACFSKKFGRRKSWLVPIQLIAGILMVGGSGYVERELGLGAVGVGGVGGSGAGGGSAVEGDVGMARDLADAATTATKAVLDTLPSAPTLNVKGPTLFFFTLYFLMATQDIAVDGWALTMLSKKNRGKGPICNSIGQNIGYFLSYVGFLALNDAESSENLWRPLLSWCRKWVGLPPLESRPEEGLVSLGGFVKFMGGFMLVITILVGMFKREVDRSVEYDCWGAGNGGRKSSADMESLLSEKKKKPQEEEDEDQELDAAEIGIRETYHRLYAAVRLPAVQNLILILLTYRLPCALSDNVKFLKAVEFGLSKQTTALLSPTIVLPLGILVPIIATKIWHGHPLKQFMAAYKFRVTFVALVDVLMLLAVRAYRGGGGGGDGGDGGPGLILGGEQLSKLIFWSLLIASTAFQATVHSLQFNSQMTFFAHRVDPAIGGTYMTLLNTFANLGGTWPSSVVMYLIGQFTVPPTCAVGEDGVEVCTGGRDAYFPLQLVFSALGCLWVFIMGKRVQHIADLPDDAWRTHIGEGEEGEEELEDLKKGGKSA